MHETSTRTLAEQLPPTEVVLARDDAFDIAAPMLVPGQVQVVATIRTSETPDGFSDELDVIDVRQAPVGPAGYKLVGDALQAQIHPAAQYILADKLHVNYAESAGFANIYAGIRPFVYGRQGDEPNRFPTMGNAVSRQHFSIEATESGVRITDLGSTNRTAVRQAPTAERHPSPSERVVHAVGQALTERPPKPRLNTAPEAGRILQPMETLDYIRRSINQVPQHGAVANEVMKIGEYGLAPVAAVRLGEKEFAFSKIIDGTYKQAVGYVRLENGDILPRMYYKSNSDGGWRVTPHVETHDANRYNKGKGGIDGGYVQLTKPAEEITQLLEGLEQSQGRHVQLDEASLVVLRSSFSTARQYQEMLAFFDNEVQRVRLDDMEQSCLYTAYAPGKGFLKDAPTARQELANIQLPQGFEPDFRASEQRSYTATHTIAGDMEVKVFGASYRGEPIEWHVAETADGMVWPDKIVFTDTEHQDIGTYGTPTRVIVAGALSAKPFEYARQVTGMEVAVDYLPVRNNTKYVSLRPYWDNMQWVQRYRQRNTAAV